MEGNNYQRTITVHASATEAMEKICRLDGWWRKDFSGSAGKLHHKFRVRFGEPSFVDFVVTEMVPGSRLVWRVAGCYLSWFNDRQEWNNTEVVFELSEAKGETNIKFTHKGLVRQMGCYEICEKGWDGHVTVNLAKFINERTPI